MIKIVRIISNFFQSFDGYSYKKIIKNKYLLMER